MASCDEIEAVVHSKDNTIDTNLEGVNDADPETRNLTGDDFDQRGWEKSLFINSMPIRQSFLQFTGVENPCTNSVTSQVNWPRSVVIYDISVFWSVFPFNAFC